MSQSSEGGSEQGSRQFSNMHSSTPPGTRVDAYESGLQSVETEEGSEVRENGREIENRIGEFFRELSEETSQLGESVAEEKKLIADLCDLLAQILRSVRVTLEIPARRMINLRDAGQVRLDSEGQVIVILDDGATSKALKLYPAETILEIFWAVFPEVGQAIKTYRNKVIKRVGLMEKIKNELTNLQKALHSVKKDDSVRMQEQRDTRAPLMEEP
ncbi:MAG: hypothetical protein NWF11_06685 [Candidatus Bathyarchaeota archaeon]|nr:hypothetical protein [Candidatus Bathyarchaeota archaeon]